MSELVDKQWPPHYVLRVNRRAKHIFLKISPHKGLELVIPRPSMKNDALIFLDKRRNWVLKNLSPVITPLDVPLPDKIHLLAVDKIWLLRYEHLKSLNNLKILSKPHELVIYGDTANKERCCKVLQEWLRTKAEELLVPWIISLSEKYHFRIKQIVIKSQQSRWGSCSRTGNINLNDKLLFLPKAYVEYILLHELCHTIHFNHSAKFWQLLHAYVPEGEQIRKQLRKADSFMPAFIQVK